MKRINIIELVGKESLISNIENDEFSYPKAFKDIGLQFPAILSAKKKQNYQKLDIRFVKNDVSVLIETKDDFTASKNKEAKEQLSAYVEYEKFLTGNKIVAILANTIDDRIEVYRGAVSESNLMNGELAIRSIDEYVEFYSSKVNDKEKVMKNTYKLNELLHKHSIPEKIRSQFIGTCLLALKDNLDYSSPKLSSAQIRIGIKGKLENLLTSDMNKAFKLSLLSKNVLENQIVRELDIAAFREILRTIKDDILPFINDKSTAGQDLLNLFFITFNKYVGKTDKNQAFTPDHITDFMTKITGVNYLTRVLDITCGSGSFLVRAMTAELDDCPTAIYQAKVKKDNIYGIEYDENIFGLATTNMLIHGDGNSNIMNGSCFDYKDWIREIAKPNVILMNPPYNAKRDSMDSVYTKTWRKDQKEDPSKGLYFVKWITDILNMMKSTATIAVILPVACAIGNSKELKKIKNEILINNTLDAVFTLPSEIFYPGASVASCCMIFKTGIPHNHISNSNTFFGYYKKDGFIKKKNLGRIEQVDPTTNESKWGMIERRWIELYRNRVIEEGMSITKKISGKDEWLCEAHMDIVYKTLKKEEFEQTINKYLSHQIALGKVDIDVSKHTILNKDIKLNISKWKTFNLKKLFKPYLAKAYHKNTLTEVEENGYKIKKKIAYISRTLLNNGMDCYVELENKFELESDNAITVGAEGVQFFYQSMKFICGNKISVLRNKNLNIYIAMFLITVLNHDIKSIYDYGRALVKGKVENTNIPLPTNEDGNPDWSFMEKYIKNLKYSNRL